MFGKILNIGQDAKTYKSNVKTQINVPNIELRVHDEVKHQQKTDRINEIIHKMMMGYDVLYDEYTYVLSVDASLASRIDNYRRFRMSFREKLYSLNHEEAINYYELSKKQLMDTESEYHRAIDCVYSEYLRHERRENISLSI